MRVEGVAGAKNALRSEMRLRLAAVEAGVRARESARVTALIGGSEVWLRAGTVGLFVARSDEIDTGDLLELAWASGKGVVVPAWREKGDAYQFCAVGSRADLRLGGRFGILEPAAECREVPAGRLDFVAVPGLAFDPLGRRLGRGKGIYDRLLAGVNGVTCGVGFGFQLVPQVPVEPHDLTLNLVVTALGWSGPAASP